MKLDRRNQPKTYTQMLTYHHKCPTCSRAANGLIGANPSPYAPRCAKCGCKMLRVFGAIAKKLSCLGAQQNEKGGSK
jgi:predicted nucleic acid-binding Zn ribbon protein